MADDRSGGMVSRARPWGARPWGAAHRRAALRGLGAGVAALLVACSVAAWSLPGPGLEPGVLEADVAWARADWAAGIRLAVVNIEWSRWQPGPHHLGLSYVRTTLAALRRYRSLGWQVAVDPGLQDPPAWVLSLPQGQLVDQRGQRSGTADYEFSAAVRAAAGAYLTGLVARLGPVQAYRVGVSQNGEMLYPTVSAGQWWAFGATAQGRAAGRPAGLGPSPLPGWVPGHRRWRGRPVSPAQVQAWYAWYLGALVSAESWEIRTYRRAGFSGQLQLVMPGYGATPRAYQDALDGDLASSPTDPFHTLNAGAVWWQVLASLPAGGPLAVDISSVGDGSGAPTQRICRPGDASVALAGAEPIRSGWSDTRWLAYLARLHGFGVVGENPGNTPPGGLSQVMDLTRGCHLSSLMWAWDFQLHGRGRQPSVSLGQLSRALRKLDLEGSS